MKFLQNTILSRITRIGAFTVVFALVGYIYYLINNQYHVRAALQEAEQHNLLNESERRAMEIGYFYSERVDNLRDIAQSSEVRGYFENRALGMSLEYGLQASIIIMEDYFKRLTRSKMLGERPIYERLMLLGRNGAIIADSGQGWLDRNILVNYLSDENGIGIHCIGSGDKARILMVIPCYFKQEPVAHLMAEISPTTVYTFFLGKNDKQARYPFFMLHGNDFLHLTEKARRLLPEDMANIPRQWYSGAQTRFKNSEGIEVKAVLNRVKDTPFTLVTLMPASSLPDVGYPRKLMLTMVAVALSILVGMLFLLRYAANNAALQAHLEETKLREKAVEEQNRLLEAESAERRRVEEEIRLLNAGLEERVMRRTADLESSNRELEAFCYSVSHDLRAPLTRLEGFSKVLLEEYGEQLGGEGEQYLDRMLHASMQLKDTVDALLDLTRLSRNEIAMTDLDLSGVVREICKEFEKTDRERKVEYLIAPKVQVSGDQHLLRLVMENLLGNAWKFTGTKQEARIEFGIIDHSRRPVYYIRDNGAGFAMEYSNKLFVPFQRLHSSAEFTGTGIGLAMAQRIIQRHGGRIWAEGEVGQGATFFFTLWEQPEGKALTVGSSEKSC
jgi:signal transduction histidine kinase